MYIGISRIVRKTLKYVQYYMEIMPCLYVYFDFKSYRTEYFRVSYLVLYYDDLQLKLHLFIISTDGIYSRPSVATTFTTLIRTLMAR